jgi:pimeloyl-ACP methyl ester carboxylesterase
MKKIRAYYCIIWLIIVHFIISSPINAQEPVASNGKFATVKGRKIYYEETGKGAPLLLLHGFFRTSSYWKEFAPEFSKTYRVIAIDLPGHGRSDYMNSTDVYSHKEAAEFIIAFLDGLHIDSVYVMGASAGAVATLHMATLKPELTKKIIVIAGQVYLSSSTRNIISLMGPGTEDPKRLEPAIQTHGKVKGPLLLRQFWNFRKLYGDPAFTPDALATIKAKALIIHGDDDNVAPVKNAWEMYQHIPRANLWIVPSGGHVPEAIPANHDDFVRRTLEFLRGDWERNE